MPALAPNGTYVRLDYRGADGVWRPLDVKAYSAPQPRHRMTTPQVVRGSTVGKVGTELPISKGSMTLMDIPPSPTSFRLKDAVLGTGLAAGTGFVGVNDAIERTVDSRVRLIDLRETWDVSSIRGRNYYKIITGVECMIPETASEADDGNTIEVPFEVLGEVGAPVYTS